MVKDCDFLTYLDLSDLEAVEDGGVTITKNPVLGDVDLSSLGSVVGSFQVNGSFAT